jgi:response regulator RpfG family c-di-GMP phosphodiesterase
MQRVYRPKPVPRDAVIRRIQEGRRTDLDPQVADAFMRSLDRFAAVEDISDFAY